MSRKTDPRDVIPGEMYDEEARVPIRVQVLARSTTLEDLLAEMDEPVPGAPLSATTTPDLSDRSLLSACMRRFRTQLVRGFYVDQDTGFHHDCTPLALVFNARTLPQHRCWDNMKRVPNLVPPIHRSRLALYGCLDCMRTHHCRGASVTGYDISDLCPVVPTAHSGGRFVCVFSGREVEDAVHHVGTSSYNDWLEKQDLHYGGDDGADPDAPIIQDEVMSMRMTSRREIERSQFTTDGSVKRHALDAKRGATRMLRGLRQMSQFERAASAARRFTKQNIVAYRANILSSDSTLALLEEELPGEAEEEEDDPFTMGLEDVETSSSSAEEPAPARPAKRQRRIGLAAQMEAGILGDQDSEMSSGTRAQVALIPITHHPPMVKENA